MITHRGNRTFKVPYNGAETEVQVQWHLESDRVVIDAVTKAGGMQKITLDAPVRDHVISEIALTIYKQRKMAEAV